MSTAQRQKVELSQAIGCPRQCVALQAWPTFVFMDPPPPHEQLLITHWFQHYCLLSCVHLNLEDVPKVLRSMWCMLSAGVCCVGGWEGGWVCCVVCLWGSHMHVCVCVLMHLR